MTRGMPYKPRFVRTIAVTSPKTKKSPNRRPLRSVFFLLAVRRALLPLPPPMAPKRGKGAVRKVKQSLGKEKAAVGPTRAAPLPQLRVTQALYSPSLFASEEGIARARSVLVAEFFGATS